MIAIDSDWVFNQACRLSHDIQVTLHKLFNPLLKLIKQDKNDACNHISKTPIRDFAVPPNYQCIVVDCSAKILIKDD